MPKESIHIIVMVTFDPDSDSITIDPLSVHSNLNDALLYTQKLEEFGTSNNFFSHNGVEASYDVLEFYLDEPPIILKMLEKKRNALQNDVEQAIIGLMKKGIVDQLIGEDGHFYYKVTEKGKKKMEGMNISPLVRRILKRNDED